MRSEARLEIIRPRDICLIRPEGVLELLGTYSTYMWSNPLSQLHFYVPDDEEKRLRELARRAGLPLSRFLADLVRREARAARDWPEGYFEEVFGRWEGETLRREPEGDYEKRTGLE